MKTRFIFGSLLFHVVVAAVLAGFSDESSGEKARAGKSQPAYSATMLTLHRETAPQPVNSAPESPVAQEKEVIISQDIPDVSEETPGDMEEKHPEPAEHSATRNPPDAMTKIIPEKQPDLVKREEPETASSNPQFREIEKQPTDNPPPVESSQKVPVPGESYADNPQQSVTSDALAGDNRNHNSLGGNAVIDSKWANYKESVFSAIHAQKVYPRQARIRRAEGVVTVKFVINQQGGVESFKLLKRAKSKHLNKSTEKLFAELRLPEPDPSIHPRFPSTLTVPIKYSIN